MEHKALHREGPTFSRIISGAWRWNLEESKIEQLIQASLDSGITTFDHADIYGDHSNEEIFGNVLKKNPYLIKWPILFHNGNVYLCQTPNDVFKK